MRLLLATIAVLLLAGCVATADTPTLRLSDLQPLPPPLLNEKLPLRVAVAAVISPKGTVESFQPLLDYLSRRLGRPVELVQRRTYAEINELVESGAVDMAFVCTSAYLIGNQEFGMQLLAAPQVDGKTEYYSLLIVPAGSRAASMADLQGSVFAFTDPMSNTGRNFPTDLVQQLGDSPEDFFSRTFFTYSHDDAIRAVADGLADGAAVDSLVYAFSIRREPALGAKTRVIHRSQPFGIPPVVVNPLLHPQLKAELKALLLGMSADPEGQAALQSIGIERFVEVTDATYQSARELQARVAAGILGNTP